MMKAQILLIFLLIAGTVGAPVASAEPSEAPHAECEFITIFPFAPFIIIDWNCPPVTPTGGF